MPVSTTSLIYEQQQTIAINQSFNQTPASEHALSSIISLSIRPEIFPDILKLIGYRDPVITILPPDKYRNAIQMSVLDPAYDKVKGKIPIDFSGEQSDFVKQRKTHTAVNSCSKQGLIQTWIIKSSYFN